MYAAEMVGSCGIGSWTRNSRIVLATASNITMPFTVIKELYGVFSHEPASVSLIAAGTPAFGSHQCVQQGYER